MNHEILKRVIADQHDVIKEAEIIDRGIELEENANYVITGVRRAGKSTLLYKVVQDLVKQGVDYKQIIYINFEDERLAEFKSVDFDDIVMVAAELSDKKPYYFFDEIQIINNWEKFARRLADSKERVYITGSNSSLLSSEIESTLGGRFLTKHVDPYSFLEYLKAKNVDNSELLSTTKIGRIKALFNEYYTNGGFPESLLFFNKREYVNSVYKKILLGDVSTRFKIRNDEGLKLLVKKIAETVKNDVSYSKLFNVLKSIGVGISKDKVIDYISFLKQAYLLFDLKNYSSKFVDKESNSKYYFVDNGLLNLFLVDENSSLLENVVACYLYRKYKEDLYYVRSSEDDIDLDFYVDSKKIAIQVAYSLSDPNVRKREIDSIINLARKYNVDKLFIVTYEQTDAIKYEDYKINVIPAYEFIRK